MPKYLSASDARFSKLWGSARPCGCRGEGDKDASYPQVRPVSVARVPAASARQLARGTATDLLPSWTSASQLTTRVRTLANDPEARTLPFHGPYQFTPNIPDWDHIARQYPGGDPPLHLPPRGRPPIFVPKPQPFPRADPPVRIPPRFREVPLKVAAHLVLCSDDDGSNFANWFIPWQFQAALPWAEHLLRKVGISFSFSPDKDVTSLRSTALNRECGGADCNDCSGDMHEDAKNARYTWIRNQPELQGKVVYFFYDYGTSDRGTPCKWKPADGGYTSIFLPGIFFVGRKAPVSWSIAHETAHFFGLDHTLDEQDKMKVPKPIRPGETEQERSLRGIEEAIRDKLMTVPAERVLDTLDFDYHTGVHDTPWDPKPLFTKALGLEVCRCLDKTLTVRVDGHRFDISPDLRNLMAYSPAACGFADPPVDIVTLTDDQQRVIWANLISGPRRDVFDRLNKPEDARNFM